MPGCAGFGADSAKIDELIIFDKKRCGFLAHNRRVYIYMRVCRNNYPRRAATQHAVIWDVLLRAGSERLIIAAACMRSKSAATCAHQQHQIRQLSYNK